MVPDGKAGHRHLPVVGYTAVRRWRCWLPASDVDHGTTACQPEPCMSPTKVSRMSRLLLIVFAIVLALYLALCLGLWLFQRSLIYFPQPGALDSSASRMTLTVDAVPINVSIRPHDGPKALLYFGGNAEDVSRNLPEFSATFPGHALYLLHYRGFGGSGGSPSEEALAQDALALFDEVQRTHPQIAVIGRSLGSGVAIRLASQRPVARLVLITPFNSLGEIAARQYPIFPVQWLLRDRFESWRYAPSITVPTRLIAAQQDDIIPRASTERLYRQFKPGVASLIVLPGVGHNSISEAPEYRRQLTEGL